MKFDYDIEEIYCDNPYDDDDYYFGDVSLLPVKILTKKCMDNLDLIPIQELQDLLTCRKLKEKYVIEQNYDDAAEIRDLEKIIMQQHPHLPYLGTKEIEVYLRDRKINKIING